MRNALNKLADTVTDPAEKKVSTYSYTCCQCIIPQSAILGDQ